MKPRNYRPTSSTMPAEVQVISAPWCKRCQVVKPSVAEYCKISGASYAVVEYDELEESEQATVKSLPTIRMRVNPDAGWLIFTADTIDAWREMVTKISLVAVDTDF